MEITVTIPDEVASQMLGEVDPSRALVELAGLNAYREGRLSDYELMGLLRMETRWEVWEFLKQRAPDAGRDTAESVAKDLEGVALAQQRADAERSA